MGASQHVLRYRMAVLRIYHVPHFRSCTALSSLRRCYLEVRQ